MSDDWTPNVAAMNFAMRIDIGAKATNVKWVLLCLAVHSDSGGTARFNMKGLASVAGFSARTVKKHLQELVERDLIRWREFAADQRTHWDHEFKLVGFPS